MSDFILAEVDEEYLIDSFEDKNPFVVNLNDNKDGVSLINIYDEDTKNSYAMKKFTKMYILFLKKVQSAFDEEGSDTSFGILLDELARLKDILLYKYKKYLKIEQYNYFLGDMEIVEGTLKEEFLKFKRKNFRR